MLLVEVAVKTDIASFVLAALCVATFVSTAFGDDAVAAVLVGAFVEVVRMGDDAEQDREKDPERCRSRERCLRCGSHS